jgi:RNA polymerase subunit RPABC4/transcription elongation factor Spt4
VETARCPACNAVVAHGADWCTLCFADLRVPEPVAAAPAAALLTPARPSVPHAPAPGATVGPDVGPAAAEPAAPTWPCTACGAAVPFALDACPECGAGFLTGGDAGLHLAVPGVGDLATANTGMRVAVGLAAGAVLCVAFMLVLLVLGKLL